MNNPFARFAEQAEVNLGDLSRRAIESVTLPVRIKSQQLIGEVTASVTATLRTLVIKAVLAVFAGVMAIIALAYALSALHSELTRVFGPIEATLMMAGAFALLAVVAVLAMVFWPKPSAAATLATAAKADAEHVAAATRREAERVGRKVDNTVRAPGGSTAEAADMKSGLGAIAAALGEAGFKREQAGLRAGLALAEQLRPVQLVSLALIGGFVAGLRLARRR